MTELVQPIKRVEQYLYALCVLDFSNIPVPRSRLEIFTHAMITGEVPEIAPETREEEYMVAIIKGDVSNLPTPKSRADHLLYRICLGETEIRDIELETRYEMLLAYLAEHGGTDLEHALINFTKAFETLYNTVEMPVKSAILSGNTLVNLIGEKREYLPADPKTLYGWEFMLPYNLTSGKTYLAIFDVSGTIDESNSKVYLMNNGFNSTSGNTSSTVPTFSLGHNVVKCIATNDIHKVLRIRTTYNKNEKFTVSNVMLIEYQDGMENWDIPYFEGMKSVQMPVLTTTGKNLLNLSSLSNSCSVRDGGYYIDVTPIKGGSNYNLFSETVGLGTVQRDISNFIKLKPNTTYTLSMVGEASANVCGSVFDLDGNRITGTFTLTSNVSSRTFTTTENAIYFAPVLSTAYSNETSTIIGLQLEEGNTGTTFEPHKSNILTVNEPIELRGIGNVQDTLDLMTGEKVERVGEIVLDGSNDEKWKSSSNTSENCYCAYSNVQGSVNTLSSVVVCDSLPTINILSPTKDYEGCILNRADSGIYGNIVIKVNKNKLTTTDIAGLKTYLQSNPITIQYQLATESVKTVDLIIQDQDNQPTTLKTFNDVTYVKTQAESVLPTVILEYGTKNQEVLAALSQDHEEVADAQAALSDAIDSQSDEVETTMMALTEVYEGRNEE